jgi:prolipoprotein diacylglyceryltransferase
MDKMIKLGNKTVVIIYLIIDIICVGAGMGVPIFCIILGFPLGWFIARRTAASAPDPHSMNKTILKLTFLASAFTFLLMIVIWGRTIPMLFNPRSDFQNFGHPFILYDPKMSFIGWLVLMMIVSPFLQLLATIFASFVTLVRIGRESSDRGYSKD